MIQHNASYFLDGISCLNVEKLNDELVSRVLDPNLGDGDMADKCFSIISCNPNLIEELRDTSKLRLMSVLDEKIEKMTFGSHSTKLNHPTIFIKRIFDQLGHEYLLENFKDQTKEILKKIPYREGLINQLISQSEELRLYYFDILIEKAGSSDFETANNFIDRFFDIDSAVASIFSKEQCFNLVIKIIKAAGYGAWRPGEVVEGKFRAFPFIKDKTLQFLDEDSNALATIKHELGKDVSVSEFQNRYLIIEEQPESV